MAVTEGRQHYRQADVFDRKTPVKVTQFSEGQAENVVDEAFLLMGAFIKASERNPQNLIPIPSGVRQWLSPHTRAMIAATAHAFVIGERWQAFTITQRGGT